MSNSIEKEKNMTNGKNSTLSLIKKDMKYRLREVKKHRALYMLMAPYLILFCAFTLLPVLIAIYFSFTSFNILEEPKFIGLQNYFRLFLNDEVFMIGLKNTMIFAVITGPLGFILPLVFAWLINELPRKLRVIFTVIFYAPSLTGGMTVVWNYLFSADAKGLFNAWLLEFGLIDDAISWTGDSKYMMGVMIFVILWTSMGTAFLSFIGGLQGIDKQYYEAAAIDGIRNRWQELWYITLPLMKPQLLFGAVMSITSSFGIGSIIDSIMGFPSADYAVHTVMNHLNDYGTTRYEMGYACAMATLLFIVMLGSNTLIQKLLRKVGT